MRKKKDRSPCLFRRKQSFIDLANLSSKETFLVRARARANDAKNYAQYMMRNAILRNHLKEVRANCLCESLLRTQFMSQRHATSCASARAKEEIYSHEGMVSVVLTLLRFNSLGWSVTPTFSWIDDFLY